jgi:hypothetical protein
MACFLSDFPFLKPEDTERGRPSGHATPNHPKIAIPPPITTMRESSFGPPIERLRQQSQSSQISSLSTMSFGSDNPFTGSVTQSALEEAFLDMAGSRLDASSVLLASRYSMTNSRRVDPNVREERMRQANGSGSGRSPHLR